MVKSLIDVKTQIGVFKKYKEDIFQQNGKPKSCADTIYGKLMMELKGMSAKAIQISINRNKISILEDQVPSVSEVRFEFVNFDDNSNLEDDNGSVHCDQNNIRDNITNDDTAGLFPSDFLDVQVVTDETLETDIQIESAEDADNSFPIFYHSDESFHKIYHKNTSHQEQTLLNKTTRELTLFAGAHLQRIQSFENIRSQQDEEVTALQTEKNGLIDRLKTADDEIIRLEQVNLTGRKQLELSRREIDALNASHQELRREQIERRKSHTDQLDRETTLLVKEINKLRVEVANLTEINGNIGRDYVTSQNQRQLQEQSLAEQYDIVSTLRSENNGLMDRQKFAEEEINKLRVEVANLTEINGNIGRDYATSQNQRQLQEQSLAEQYDIVSTLRSENNGLMDRQKFAEGEIKKCIQKWNIHC